VDSPFAPANSLDWSSWLAGLQGTGGRVKTTPEDFQVEEIPAYEPVGDGEYVYLWVKKRDVSADHIRRELARVSGITPREVGMAGLKDRNAITWQWISVPLKANPAGQGLCGAGWTVLRAVRHRNKLRPGHLRGNRFRLVVREAKANWESLLGQIVDHLKKVGVPNAYGAQRFGRDRQTLALGLSLLENPQLPVNPWLRRLALSAVQSHVFNTWVLNRLKAGTLRQVIEGEILGHCPRGGLFTAVDLVAEQKRLEAGEIVPAGPIPGSRILPAKGPAGLIESQLLKELNLCKLMDPSRGRLFCGTRRRALLYPSDLVWHAAPEVRGYRLEFSLPEGSYATVLAGMLLEGESWRGPEAGEKEGMDEAGEEGLTEESLEASELSEVEGESATLGDSPFGGTE